VMNSRLHAFALPVLPGTASMGGAFRILDRRAEAGLRSPLPRDP
jgi:hypothetical protein